MRRSSDIVIASVLILVSLPVQALVAVVVRLVLGKPVLFSQDRVGKGEHAFRLVKFRTMTLDVDSDGRPLSDIQRLTRTGNLLRRFSLDELPELWNVLRGDMSIVGPRPLPVRYLPRYRPTERRRHEVRPGLTGWAQVNGRNEVDWQDRFAMDVWYVDNRSALLNLKILARTVGVVLHGRGVGGRGEVTMSELRPDPPDARPLRLEDR